MGVNMNAGLKSTQNLAFCATHRNEAFRWQKAVHHRMKKAGAFLHEISCRHILIRKTDMGHKVNRENKSEVLTEEILEKRQYHPNISKFSLLLLEISHLVGHP
jgi:hypothetical protein